MSWMEKLYQTYEAAIQLDLSTETPLIPISHISQNAHINIVIDEHGNFRHAFVLGKNTRIFLPATEKSANCKTGKTPPPSPLAEKLRYVAKDYSKFGGKKAVFFNEYHALLKSWCDSTHCHPKANAVFQYVSQGNVVADLVKAKVLVVEESGQLSTPKEFKDPKNKPDIFKVLNKDNTLGVFDQGDALVCWSVEIKDDPCPETWKDNGLQDKWNAFNSDQEGVKGLCFITGETTTLAYKHPKNIRKPGDSAKLISSNDFDGFTFRGKFTDDSNKTIEKLGCQAMGIGSITTQKAHNALSWLIQKQGFKNGDQVYVSWAVSCKDIPEPLADINEQFDDEPNLDDVEPSQDVNETQATLDYGADLGEAYAKKLRKYMAGYATKLDETDQIIIMGLDSASDGRMGILYYREMSSAEFLGCLKNWHEGFSWYQNYGWDDKKNKNIQFVGAPAPKDISEVAYGHRDDKGKIQLDNNLLKSTIERLLPCIIEALPIPFDLVDLTVRRTCNRIGMKTKKYNGKIYEVDWEKTLGITCALYRGYYARHPDLNKRRTYAMALDENYHARDYLYGRLLAVAERIESVALSVTDENRSTNAARLMQRFADRPAQTWLLIYKALAPYMQRLQVSRTAFLNNQREELETIMAAFTIEDFNNNAPLLGEFLLGYYCQRQKMKDDSAENKKRFAEKKDHESKDNEANLQGDPA